MRAVFQTGYGSPDFFEIRETEQPAVRDNQVLVRVRAAALHAGDKWFMRGVPYMVRFSAGLPRPKAYIPGFDFAGQVEAVGNKVRQFKPGDQVFGAHKNTCAGYVSVSEGKLVAKPENLTFEQAAAVPTSALAALQGLRDAGRVRPGQRVLINGASGGVGTFAVQIARVLGADVSGVCSTEKTDLVRSLGANQVIDYTREDFTQGKERYDLILDQVANHPLSSTWRVLKPGGVHIPNSGNSGLGYVIRAFFASLVVRRQGRPFISMPKTADLLVLKEMLESGQLKPMIDRTFSLNDIRGAFRHLDRGHPGGKVVITIDDNKKP